ncbi:glycogen debranching N-terminal domain-containing protein [Streptomyces sp. HNM0663]|uniref:Glycogen debranching N-terminal domain-containing protein n=1 Tax=Streptomyces chengmaiensis TaxID=3040919 RepID=A0ABT6HT94_9ACTN|nr:glycogen debranching N-terminal domain-containing protein [Streptomyces chengmaiensis]MDH2391942.1 glycogen debranching N-terminal domain-containing protein [Streptomyces chengmaiensis]
MPRAAERPGRVAPPPAARPREPAPVHHLLICAALPCLALSAEHGQLTGRGVEGVYHSGRRLLSRCRLRVAGREPVAVQGRVVSAGLAVFKAVVRTPADTGPDPEVGVERSRAADGTERITLRSSATRPLRLSVEVALGTDLAEFGAIAAGRTAPELPASVHDAGLRWAAAGAGHAIVTADPPPRDTLASAGLLRWELDLSPGAARSIELRVRSERPARTSGRTGGLALAEARAEGDDPRLGALLATGLGDFTALLLRDPEHPADVYPAAGVPWRCGPAPAEALWAARVALPISTGLAAAALRRFARSQLTGRGRDFGRIPGPLRDAGPHLPPICTGVEATLAFPAVLAEARRWGMPDKEVVELLPAAEHCLRWLGQALDEGGLLPEPGPSGIRRTEIQAHAHRAALLGADLLDGCGRPGAEEWRQRAGRMRSSFRELFWVDDLTGGRPAAALLAGGRPVPLMGAGAVHLLDTGLLGLGQPAAGLLDKVQTEQLARLLGGPAMDSGWGLRGLGAKEPGHNPFGHRSGAVRVHETAVAVAGLAAAGYEKEAASLLRGLLDAAPGFGHRLPEMYAGEQRTAGAVTPAPHPAACRPAALPALAGLHLLMSLAGIRPDVPSGTVALHPMRSAPFGAVQISGLRVAGEPFAVRISRLGQGMVEQAAAGLQLGV